MELKARIFLIVSISSLILYLSVEGLNILPSLAQPNSQFDEVNQLAKDQGLDEAKEASDPVSPTVFDEAAKQDEAIHKAQDQVDSPIAVETEAEKSSPVSSPVSKHGEEAPSPTSLWDLSSVLDEAEKTLGPVSSSIVDQAEAVLSPVLSSEASSPVPSPFSGESEEAVAPTIGKGGEAVTPVSYPSSPSSSLALAPTPSGFFDHDIALAIESRIKQGQTDSQLAMDEAKKLLNDPKIASSETGKCLSKCVDKYSARLNQLNRAIADLGVRDVTLLADDFGVVESDISTCQACFTENVGDDSPLKALEEATTKAARECLTVMDYAS